MLINAFCTHAFFSSYFGSFDQINVGIYVLSYNENSVPELTGGTGTVFASLYSVLICSCCVSLHDPSWGCS